MNAPYYLVSWCDSPPPRMWTDLCSEYDITTTVHRWDHSSILAWRETSTSFNRSNEEDLHPEQDRGGPSYSTLFENC